MGMDVSKIVKTLIRKRELLESCICLSEEQLLLLADENLKGFNMLLHRRADLMIELTALESILRNSMMEIQNEEIRSINDEIVCLANHIVAIDEQAHIRLDLIKQRAHAQIQKFR